MTREDTPNTDPLSDDAPRWHAPPAPALQPPTPPVTAQPRHKQRDPRESATRGLVLGWCLWLLGCWAVTLAMPSTILPSRWMMMSCLIGMMALWPAFRLSQDIDLRSERGGATHGMTAGMVLTDWLCLVLVFQAVVWPLRLMAGWSAMQTVWLDLQVTAWSLLTGAVVAIGCGKRSGWFRTGAMILCIVLLIGEPLCMLVGIVFGWSNLAGWTPRLTPAPLVWNMSGPAVDWQWIEWAPTVISVGVAGVLAWIGVFWWRSALGLKAREE